MIIKLALTCLFFLCAIPVRAQADPANVIFWNELQKLCGKAFAGTVAAAPPDDTTFKDKLLVMHVRACEKNRIRIPFVVGTDRSRTWVLTRQKDRILLKHDHRHEDGKPDKVTMYGGWTTSAGMPTRQMFPADQETVNIIPAAATNVWWIDLVPGEHFSYNLRRMGSERYFSIKFDLKTPVKAPEAPWGWKVKIRKQNVMSNSGDTMLPNENVTEQVSNDNIQQALLDLANEWGKAIVSNDAHAISRFMADDWVIVSQTGISEKGHFLSFVQSGDLTHEAMEMKDGTARVRIYGDTAVLTGRVTNTAHYKGEEFHADEWTTDVFIRRDGKWLCVLSHITPVETK